jgi:hypothetical protein
MFKNERKPVFSCSQYVWLMLRASKFRILSASFKWTKPEVPYWSTPNAVNCIIVIPGKRINYTTYAHDNGRNIINCDFFISCRYSFRRLKNTAGKVWIFLAFIHSSVHKTICNIRLRTGVTHWRYSHFHGLLYSQKLYDVRSTRCICSSLSNARI